MFKYFAERKRGWLAKLFPQGILHQVTPKELMAAGVLAVPIFENAPTQKFARTMALDTTNHDVYLVTAEIEEAPPAKEGERPRRTMKPGTFTLLVVGKN